MIDIEGELNAIRRETGRQKTPVGDARTVVLQRRYDAGVEDVWDAITDPERITRWFMPVSGDLRLGGTYQLTGNAGGEILACEPPRLLKVSWIYGDLGENDISEVEVRLSTGDDGRTVFELEHLATVPAEMWDQFGPGAVGVGWDLALLGLSLHLQGGEIREEEREAWGQSPEARDFMTRSSQAWGAAYEAGGATSAEAAAAVANTTQFYAPDPDATPNGDAAGS